MSRSERVIGMLASTVRRTANKRAKVLAGMRTYVMMKMYREPRTCVVVPHVESNIIVIVFVVSPVIAVDICLDLLRVVYVNYIGLEFRERNRAEYLILADGIHTNLDDEISITNCVYWLSSRQITERTLFK